MKLAAYDRPAIAKLQSPESDLCNRLEHQNDGGTVPTHLTHADTDAGTVGQYDLDHPAIVIDLTELECECEYSHFKPHLVRQGTERRC